MRTWQVERRKRTRHLIELGGLIVKVGSRMMDNSLKTHHHEEIQPADTLQGLADALPALGIVAAVLGVVKTMGSIDKPPAILGHEVAGEIVAVGPAVKTCAIGDRVTACIDLDTAPREVPIPEDLAAALDADPQVRRTFDALPYTRRKEYARAVDDAKRADTRARRIEQTVAQLRED